MTPEVLTGLIFAWIVFCAGPGAFCLSMAFDEKSSDGRQNYARAALGFFLIGPLTFLVVACALAFPSKPKIPRATAREGGRR